MSRTVSGKTIIAVQGAIIAAFGVAYAASSPQTRRQIQIQITGRERPVSVAVSRGEPLAVAPLYDRPDWVSDAEMAAVLDRIVPRFRRDRTKPNFVEHAVRVWGIHAEFDDSDAMSGRELAEFLTDHARYLASWGMETDPLIDERPTGPAIRWGKEEGASAHHDHWLASLTEAGIPLDTPVYGPGRGGSTIEDVLREALRDFRLDERETEWTAMAFGLWLPPVREWTGSGGRQYSFDLLADRLMRGHNRLGVCSGTHRAYSLMLLLRIDEQFDILSDSVQSKATDYLEQVRDLLMNSQWEDGRWPANWTEGAHAAAEPVDGELFKDVISTGHHLEWLALAPRGLHPPDDQIQRAVRWVIDTTTEQTAAEVMPHYTYYSHVGNALSLWRNTHPAVFWRQWQEQRSDELPRANLRN